MTSLTQSQESFVESFQFVGQGERSSTMENPRSSTWHWKHFLIAFLAWRMNLIELRGTTLYVDHPIGHGEHPGDVDRLPMEFCITPRRCGGGTLTQKRGRGHLSPSHAVNGIVNKNRGYVFAPVGCVDGLGGPDGRQVTVTLVGEDKPVRAYPFDTGSHGLSPPVGGLNHVEIEVIVSQDRTADRRNPNGLFSQTPFIQAFSHQPVGN